MKSNYMSFYIGRDPEIVSKIKKMAKANGQSASQYIRMCVENNLKKGEKTNETATNRRA